MNIEYFGILLSLGVIFPL